ncbi:MAG: DUF2878 domain-containing protein [Pseudomonadota bacterium]
MPNLVINFLLFQTSWFALVAGAANNLLIPGAALCALFFAWELYRSKARKRLVALVVVAVAGGIIVDGSYALFGLVEYQLPAGPIAPWWIIGLWVIFALTLTESMGWMRDRIWAGALMAGIGAPLSYLAGYKLGAIEFPLGLATGLGIAALTWIPAIYVLVLICNRLMPQPEPKA